MGECGGGGGGDYGDVEGGWGLYECCIGSPGCGLFAACLVAVALAS